MVRALAHHDGDASIQKGIGEVDYVCQTGLHWQWEQCKVCRPVDKLSYDACNTGLASRLSCVMPLVAFGVKVTMQCTRRGGCRMGSECCGDVDTASYGGGGLACR